MSQKSEKIVGGPSREEISEQLFAKPEIAKPLYFWIQESPINRLGKNPNTCLSVYVTGVIREDGSGNSYILTGHSGSSPVRLYYNTRNRNGVFYLDSRPAAA